MLIKRIDTASPEYEALLRLRQTVLLDPLGVTLADIGLDRDAAAIILVAAEGTDLIGCVLLQPKEDGSVQLRQMAVHPDWQGKGIGRQLVAAAEEWAWGEGFQRVMLHAREVVAPFYEKLGYQTYGDRFIEVGIPHVFMKKDKA